MFLSIKLRQGILPVRYNQFVDVHYFTRTTAGAQLSTFPGGNLTKQSTESF